MISVLYLVKQVVPSFSNACYHIIYTSIQILFFSVWINCLFFQSVDYISWFYQSPAGDLWDLVY